MANEEKSTASRALEVDVSKARLDAALMKGGEMNSHLAREAEVGRANKRNGFSVKRARTGGETLSLSIPRDRNGDFEPQLIGKHQRRLEGFD